MNNIVDFKIRYNAELLADKLHLEEKAGAVLAEIFKDMAKSSEHSAIHLSFKAVQENQHERKEAVRRYTEAL